MFLKSEYVFVFAFALGRLSPTDVKVATVIAEDMASLYVTWRVNVSRGHVYMLSS